MNGLSCVFPEVPRDRDAIGGYFGLDLAPAAQPLPLQGALAFQSARAAFLALLQAEQPAAVWMPWFVCDSLCEPLAQAGIPLRRYALDERFQPEAGVQLAAGEWLLYVNLFGLCNAVEPLLRERFGADRLVFDHAQALFAPVGPAVATIASPRKFIATPDGGLLWTSRAVPLPAERDQGSASRATALLQRAAHGAEAGHAAYREAEASLAGQSPRAMSRLTHALLAATDAPAVAAARRRHFAHLHAALAPFNRLVLPDLADQVPLCYPLLPARPIDRAALHRARIYVPTYWPELLERALPAREASWAAGLLALPIDQRLDIDTLQRHIVAPLQALFTDAAETVHA